MATSEQQLKRLQKRFDAVWQERKNNMDEHCADIALHVLPVALRSIKGDKYHDRSAHRKIVDSTGKKGLKILAAGMLSGTCSPSRPWFSLTPSDIKLRNDIKVKQWFKTVEDVMYAEFAKSNTYRVVHHSYEQECAFGTATALIPPTEKNKPLMHMIPLTFGEYALTTDSYNVPNGIFREFELTTENMVEWFGLKNCSDKVQQLVKNENYDELIKIRHAIERRPPGIKSKGRGSKPWASIYWEADQTQKVLREGGFDRYPAVSPRWNVTGTDVYGESPASEALGDMRALQKAHEQLAKGTDYAINPPVLVPDYLKGQELQLLPSGVAYFNPSTMIGQQVSQVQAMFNVKPDYQGVFLMINEAQGRVRESFHADLFLMLDNFEKANMTATEVAERKNEKMLMLGAILERQTDELLRPLVEICFERVLKEYPELSQDVPDGVEGADTKIEFVSILAQAQKAAGTATLERFAGIVSQIAQVDPTILDKLDGDAFIDEYANITGVPANVMRGNKKIAEIRQARAEQQQAMQDQAMQQQQAQSAAQGAQAVKSLSEAEQVAGEAMSSEVMP